MSKTEQTIHNIYWVVVWWLGILSAYLFVWYSMPSTRFFQDINVDSWGWAIDMSFVTEFKWEWTWTVVNMMNCTSDLLIKEKQLVEVLPMIYKEIEVTKTFLTWEK